MRSIVVFFVLVVSPYVFGEIDPATVAGMWLFEEGGGDVAKDSSDAGMVSLSERFVRI